MADSNITKRALAAALKSLLAERPFAKVSVREICEACGMSRKSFYYHFKDKYELLNWIFETEFVARVQQTQGERNAWELLNDLCCYFYDNRDFYRRALCGAGAELFPRLFPRGHRPDAAKRDGAHLRPGGEHRLLYRLLPSTR